MSPDLSILILNWNGKTDTLACLESLEHLQYTPCTILVVDNGSSDDSVAAIHARFPAVQLLQYADNLGFAEGNNRGLQHAVESGCDYILLLNNDTRVAPDFLDILVATGEAHPEIGMLNPCIYREQDGAVWFCGGEIDWRNGVTRHLTEIPEARPSPQAHQVLQTDYVTGCALLVKTDVIRKIGLLDRRFFAYYEDTDWSVRCQKAGWTTGVVPEAKIWHKVSATAPARLAFIWAHRNLILFLWKHSPCWKFPLRFRRAVYKCLHEFTWHCDKELGEAAMHGFWSALTLSFGKDIREMPPWLLRFVKNHIRYFLALFGWGGR